jgi:hypothetical protein
VAELSPSRQIHEIKAAVVQGKRFYEHTKQLAEDRDV